jgi:hypothetical protein
MRTEIRDRKDLGMMPDSPDASDGSCGTCGTPVHSGPDVPKTQSKPSSSDNMDSGLNAEVVANSDANASSSDNMDSGLNAEVVANSDANASSSEKRKFEEDDESSRQEDRNIAYSILDGKDGRSLSDLFLKIIFEDDELLELFSLVVLPFLLAFILYVCISNFKKKHIR